MVKYLLDTNVILERGKPKPDKRVLAWLETITPLDIYISVLTMGELRTGIEMRENVQEKQQLQLWYEDDLQMELFNRVLSVGMEEVHHWAYLRANTPRKLPAIDGLLAATAVAHHLTLATHNIKDFCHIPGLQIFDPWQYTP